MTESGAMTDDEFLAAKFENSSEEKAEKNLPEPHQVPASLRNEQLPYIDPVSRRWICPNPGDSLIKLPSSLHIVIMQ